eukprot:TRINITY_DN901_c0_g1_i1.p2 TRINITY_DN901_c0_g1~~TRINITY_DN901_c0_g1_i1.p2  ORF type:complete len:324 (-),score=68.54 TRINITY_DN901_c0_g1_i1:1166-2137(-)
MNTEVDTQNTGPAQPTVYTSIIPTVVAPNEYPTSVSVSISSPRQSPEPTPTTSPSPSHTIPESEPSRPVVLLSPRSKTPNKKKGSRVTVMGSKWLAPGVKCVVEHDGQRRGGVILEGLSQKYHLRWPFRNQDEWPVVLVGSHEESGEELLVLEQYLHPWPNNFDASTNNNLEFPVLGRDETEDAEVISEELITSLMDKVSPRKTMIALIENQQQHTHSRTCDTSHPPLSVVIEESPPPQVKKKESRSLITAEKEREESRNSVSSVIVGAGTKSESVSTKQEKETFSPFTQMRIREWEKLSSSGKVEYHKKPTTGSLLRKKITL